jgi:Uma2 family endonuclease
MGKSVARISKPPAIPPLRDGDRMNAREFIRRYEATPEGFRAELVNGVVYVNRWVETGPNGEERIMPPIAGGGHGRPQGVITNLFGTYVTVTAHVDFFSPTTVILSDFDAEQGGAAEPDAILCIVPSAGGASNLGPDDYLHGPPELIGDVANSSAGYDLGPKLDMYARYGVLEYLVWRTRERAIDLFHLGRGRRYTPVPPDDDAVIRSLVFPGLWFDVEALLAGDLRQVLETARHGLVSPEHAAFVEKLRRAAARKKR